MSTISDPQLRDVHLVNVALKTVGQTWLEARRLSNGVIAIFGPCIGTHGHKELCRFLSCAEAILAIQRHVSTLLMSVAQSTKDDQ